MDEIFVITVKQFVEVLSFCLIFKKPQKLGTKIATVDKDGLFPTLIVLLALNMNIPAFRLNLLNLGTEHVGMVLCRSSHLGIHFVI